LEKNNEEWQEFQQAKLPYIEHGETPDSVYIKSLVADQLKTYTTDSEGQKSTIGLPTIKVVPIEDDTWQLQINYEET
jgi:hypothetical protein